MKPIDLREFTSGVTWWRTQTAWPDGFHNADYPSLAEQNPNGRFDAAWWTTVHPRLSRWRALRPFSAAEVGRHLFANKEALADAWTAACEPYRHADIAAAEVTWDNVRRFPDTVAGLKPTRRPSAVFTSKFCHFLLPQVFPVVDTVALSMGDGSYRLYFNLVKGTWEATGENVRQQLVAELTRLVEESGGPLSKAFPVVNKIVELALIGRNHP